MQSPEDAVRATAAAIPPGRVMTYGEIGWAIGVHPRQVGRIVARIADDIPWWRVIRADGTPATCHDNTAPALLAEEGVPFDGDRVDLRRLRSPGRVTA
ncbi:MGMT family protein [Brachybacterium sp. UNK5269]|uniref:MGMT family protein n=1 Tax=Brachybacterium sp. UNK5269 TaxID=3408576 RepID=UPI003BAE849D